MHHFKRKIMKQLITFFSITLFCCTNYISFGQYTSNDFIITTKGLSDEYSSRFNESSKKDILADMFNQLNITHVIAPIKVRVIYENNEGNVIAEINYDHDKIFTENTDYRSHNLNWSNYGKGISVYLQNQIFNALSQYP
jgi:hypothetical protein